MQKQRIALSLMVGDGQDSEKWRNLLDSVYGHVDWIYISYNGKESFFPYDIPGNATVAYNTWEDDFAKARNDAFAMIPKDEVDWIMWLDADDTLEKGENLQEMLQKAQRDGIHQVFLSYVYASDEVDGTARVVQQRERVFSTKLPWRWYYSIHEVCHTQPGSKVASYKDVFVKHHRDVDPFTHRATRERNRRILSKALELAPDEPRYTYYQANEMFAEAYYLYDLHDPQSVDYFKQAIVLYQKFGQSTPSSDDGYVANYRIGDALRMMGQWPKAIDVAMQGIKIRPRWADCWMLATHTAYGMKEYETGEEYATIALEICEEPQTNQITEPLTYYYTPYALRALCRTELGNFKGALEDYDIALEFWDNPALQERRDDCISRRDGKELKAADNARQKTFGKRPERSIAFLTRPLPEVWNAKTLAAGSGGAEWCVHEIARRFKDDGFRTAIFGSPGDERGGDAEGVEWWDSSDYDPNEVFTHVVSVRAPEVFDTPLEAAKSKTLWLHDVNMGGKEIIDSPWGNRFAKPDHVVCLTNWHSKREQQIYGIDPKKITVIGNGINVYDYPEWTEKRQKGKFIYASSPDRGIDTLMTMWPQIKERIPEAELHIYYGWNMVDKIVSLSGGQHPLAQMKQNTMGIFDSISDLDVNWYDRVSRPELASIETTCDFWLYPTHFLETYCITAIEMQMNGVIPLVNPIGALSETVPFGKQVSGMPNHPDYYNKYVDELERVYDHPEKDFQREVNRAWAEQNTWDDRYIKWRTMLGESPQKKTKGKK